MPNERGQTIEHGRRQSLERACRQIIDMKPQRRGRPKMVLIETLEWWDCMEGRCRITGGDSEEPPMKAS